MKYLDQIYGSADAFLFGRFTYNIFAKSWGAFEGSSTSAIASALNERPKYVVSNTLTEPSWSRTTIISGGVAPAIRDLKQSHEETLVVPGSGKLVRALLALELVDQIDLVIYPIVVGQGERLFPDSGPDMALELINSRTSPSGLTMQSYRTSGRPAYQQATLSTDEMSDIGQDKP